MSLQGLGRGGKGLKQRQEQAARQKQVKHKSKVRRATSHWEEQRHRAGGRDVPEDSLRRSLQGEVSLRVLQKSNREVWKG